MCAYEPPPCGACTTDGGATGSDGGANSSVSPSDVAAFGDAAFAALGSGAFGEVAFAAAGGAAVGGDVRAVSCGREDPVDGDCEAIVVADPDVEKAGGDNVPAVTGDISPRPTPAAAEEAAVGVLNPVDPVDDPLFAAGGAGATGAARGTAIGPPGPPGPLARGTGGGAKTELYNRTFCL